MVGTYPASSPYMRTYFHICTVVTWNRRNISIYIIIPRYRESLELRLLVGSGNRGLENLPAGRGIVEPAFTNYPPTYYSSFRLKYKCKSASVGILILAKPSGFNFFWVIALCSLDFCIGKCGYRTPSVPLIGCKVLHSWIFNVRWGNTICGP